VTTSHLPRRAIVGAVLATSLIGGGLVAAFAADAPSTTACPATYTDPAGDSGPLDPATNPAVGDDDLDLVAVTHSVDGGQFTTAFKVVKLDPTGPLYASGDRFVASFTVAKKAITVDAERDFTGAGDTHGSVTVDGTAVTLPVKIVEDDKASTLSAVMAVADLEKAVGTSLTGQAFSAMSAQARGFYPTNAAPNVGVLWDDATAPATASYAFGAGCGGSIAAGTPVPVPSASATPASPAFTPTTGPLADDPRADCVSIKDVKGDAAVQDPVIPNDPDLDLLAVNFRSNPDALKAFIKVDKLADAPQTGDGHRFDVTFTVGKKVVELYAGQPDAIAGGVNGALVAAGQQSPAAGGVKVDGAYLPDVKTTSVFDLKKSRVELSVDRAALEKALATPLTDGTVVTATSAHSRIFQPEAGTVLADTAQAAKVSAQTYTIGDNRCFAPPAPPFANLGALTAQYGDTAAVSAQFVDSNGNPLDGETVSFTLGKSTVSADTDENGIAKAELVVTDRAGKRSLVVASEDQKSTFPFTVTVEKTALKATGSKGAVTAALFDDDKHAVAGQVITFAAGAKKMTAKTNAKGIATVSGVPAGAVRVTYAGVSGMYSASAASAKA
jgi:hypothetical protein